MPQYIVQFSPNDLQGPSKDRMKDLKTVRTEDKQCAVTFAEAALRTFGQIDIYVLVIEIDRLDMIAVNIWKCWLDDANSMSWESCWGREQLISIS